MAHENILEIKNLTKAFMSNNETNTIIKEFNLSLEEDEFLCVLGPSGCGKTTLLRCIAGFENYEGQIKVGDTITTAPSTDRIMVFQDFNQLFPWKTVEKNIMYSLRACKKAEKKELAELAKTYLKKVNLLEYKDYYPHQLSGGMKQRVAIAKALALHPSIILMDEPFASLDAISRRNLQNELLNIKKEEKMTVIFITHNIQEALILGTRILVLGQGGKIVIDTKNTMKKPVTPASYDYGHYWELLYNALKEDSI